MLRKHAILMIIIISVILLFIAALFYPGGSQLDKHSIGYDWRNNYISNLFYPKALNGADNPARFWAVSAMLFFCTGFTLFFAEFPKKIHAEGSAGIIKYFGISAMVFAFLAVTPLHDTMITIGGTLALVSMFYITVYLFKSKLHLLKILSVICLLVFYCCNYIYYTGKYLGILPIMQKVCFFLVVIWMLSLQYFTTITDFQPRKSVSY